METPFDKGIAEGRVAVLKKESESRFDAEFFNWARDFNGNKQM